MRRLFVGMIALVAAGPALAQSMPLPTLLDKAASLERRGPLAIFSGDLKRLVAEVKASGGLVKAERLAAIKAGQKPAYCPPQKPQAMGADELLTRFRAIPANERAKMTVRDGMRVVLARKFPCGR